MSNTHTVVAENLGPIENLQFSLQPGVTVLTAPNGSGKSILLNAMQSAAAGRGKLPLRDGAKKGRVEAFGATITIGASCRHTGGFAVENIEGRFDLAMLVDPGLQTPRAADAARIKALVTLMGLDADPAMFRNHQAFTDFDEVVQLPSTPQDLVALAAQIKRCYDAAALKAERNADAEHASATALMQQVTVDINSEDDAGVLQSQYNAARDANARLLQTAQMANTYASKLAAANSMLQGVNISEQETALRALQAQLEETKEATTVLQNAIQLLGQKRLALDEEQKQLQAQLNQTAFTRSSLQTQIEAAQRQKEAIEKAERAISEARVDAPTAAELDAAHKAEQAASNAVQHGALVRAAKESTKRAVAHRRSAEMHQRKALLHRDAAKATDEVLSSAIPGGKLRVESDGDTARLMTDTIRGATPFGDLSEGERWKLAIAIGAEQVGAGGLLVISQVGWEGIDGKNRRDLHADAVRLGVYILTAEAASDPDATRAIVAVPMQDAPQPAKPAAQPATRRPPVADTNNEEIPF